MQPIVRVSILRCPPDRFGEMRQMMIEDEKPLRPGIETMRGLLAFYVGAVLGQAVLLALVPPLQAGQHVGWIVRISRSAAAIPLIILTHLLYGFGFWRGLFTPLKPGSRPPAPPVVLETVTP